jgi:hypothetical protein
MTVADLITTLQTFDGDKEVQVFDHLTHKFAEPVVEAHSKRTEIVLLLARPWHKPWTR